jgi:Flp pilus assembly protein TadG
VNRSNDHACPRRQVIASTRHRRGAAAVELAIVLPILVLLLGGIVDCGALLVASLRLANAAQAGALYGGQLNALSANTNGIRDAALADASSRLPGMTVTTSRQCRCPNGTSAETNVTCTNTCSGYGFPRVYVQVTTTATVSVLFLRPLLGNSKTMSRTVTYRSL